MTADFESAIDEIKTAFSYFKEVLIVILYGSVARGDFSRRHSDLDLFVIINNKKVDAKLKKKIDEKIASICFKHSVRAHLEFQGSMIKEDDRTLIRKLVEEGRIIFSSGIFMIDNELMGLKQYLLYAFSTKNSKKRTLFSKTLHGKKSWYYKEGEKILKEYPGIIDNKSIFFAGRGGLLVSKEKQKNIEGTFNHFNVDYKIIKIVYAL